MTIEEQKAVEEFTEMNLTKKGLYHYNDMQDAFLIGLFKGEKMQPSLPSDLDEAAKEYGRNTFINECMENGVCDNHDLSDAFKAGAEWMAGQGETFEAKATRKYERSLSGFVSYLVGDEAGAIHKLINQGEEADVIVQIRKKQ